MPHQAPSTPRLRRGTVSIVGTLVALTVGFALARWADPPRGRLSDEEPAAVPMASAPTDPDRVAPAELDAALNAAPSRAGRDGKARAWLRRLHGGDALMRADAAAELGADTIDVPHAVEELVAALSDPAPEVRVAALAALRRLGPAAEIAVPALLARPPAARDPERGPWLRTLGAVGGARVDVIDTLAIDIEAAGDAPARDAAIGLIFAGTPGLARLQRALAADSDVSDDLRGVTLTPASNEEATRLLPAFEAMLRPSAPATLRAFALRSIEATGPAAARLAAPLIAAMARATGTERARAAEALGSIAEVDPDATRALRDLLDHPDAAVRSAAARAVGGAPNDAVSKSR
jgi:hypothetical protein